MHLRVGTKSVMSLVLEFLLKLHGKNMKNTYASVHRATSYTVHMRFVPRFARMPTHGNLVYAAQWPGANVHDAVEISMPPGIGTPHGPLALRI